MSPTRYSTRDEKLCTQGGVVVVIAAPEGGTRDRSNRSHAAHFRAEMMRFQIDGDSVRLEHRLQGVGDLLTDAFLHRNALGKQAHQSRQLGNADDVLVRYVAHVGMP